MADLSLGIIGVGAMGANFWHRFHEQGFTAIVHDVNQGAVDALVAAGAAAATSPAGVASNANVVVLSLPRSPDVEAAMLGDGGLAATAAPGTVVIDTTSGNPSHSQRIATALATKGIDYLDCGVSGGVGGARAGTLKVMLGGDAGVIGRVKPIVDALGTDVWHCGGPGTGHAMKTLLNLSNQSKLLAELEALTLAAKFGLDVQRTADVLGLGAWKGTALNPAGARPFGFALALFLKDFETSHALAAELGVPLPITGAALQITRAYRRALPDDADISQIAKLLSEWNNIELGS